MRADIPVPKERAAFGVTTGAALKVFLPSEIISERDAARTVGKALQMWRYAHGFSSYRSTVAAFKAHPEWRGA